MAGSTSEVTLDLANALAGEVWGQGFPAPAFDDLFDVAEQRIVGERHLKLVQRRGAGAAVDFGHSVQPGRPASRHHPAVYRPDPNEWNGTVALQLVILHWEPAGA
jgi:single-stranded-DNA-specific exonuclease